ncbi:hypothetical protein IFR05_016501 [Cadophora sp. M221]|nr:hypothetical protein IFR05_016501 [Cadophora sp. M221]
MADTSDRTPEPKLTPETFNDATTPGETPNPGPVFTGDATAYSRKFRDSFCNGRIKGEFLFQDFWEYFEDWTASDFRMIEDTERTYLRDDLRAFGVFVRRGKGARTAHALAEVVKAEENVWPDDQLEMQIRNYPESATNLPRRVDFRQSTPPSPTLPDFQPPRLPFNNPDAAIDSREGELQPDTAVSQGDVLGAGGLQGGENSPTWVSAKASPTRGNVSDLYNATPLIRPKREFSFTPDSVEINCTTKHTSVAESRTNTNSATKGRFLTTVSEPDTKRTPYGGGPTVMAHHGTIDS